MTVSFHVCVSCVCLRDDSFPHSSTCSVSFSGVWSVQSDTSSPVFRKQEQRCVWSAVRGLFSRLSAASHDLQTPYIGDLSDPRCVRIVSPDKRNITSSSLQSRLREINETVDSFYLLFLCVCVCVCVTPASPPPVISFSSPVLFLGGGKRRPWLLRVDPPADLCDLWHTKYTRCCRSDFIQSSSDPPRPHFP